MDQNVIQVPSLVVICGPTASGKSGLAIALAQRLESAAILSADSRQVYREFDIGTAKPTIAEQQQIPHYLIDICDPTQTLTLADYQEQAQALIDEFHQGEGERMKDEGGGMKGKRRDVRLCRSRSVGRGMNKFHSADSDAPSASGPITLPETNSPLHPSSLILHPSPIPFLVGGTGLYIRSVVQGLIIPRVPPQPELRSQLQALGQKQLYAFLQQVDPASATRIHANDQVRTLRALEVFYTTGQPISAQQGEKPPDYPILQIGLDAEGDRLTRRIEQRTDQMIAAGFVDEVTTLCNKYGPDLALLNTLGYQEIKQYLAGEISLTQARDLTVLHTRQFAKRQRTWFHADPTITWFDSDASDLVEQVWQQMQQFWEKSASAIATL
ncbi:MAG: tRNA (adenosine(37)-N6)-dimethylallyltransferase MiaA [Trichocoleus desertorum ATA4-8-CV12]|jgi:tRNA dimethylallyltransferase|nr:tRNA (adenosine(37)-N6)-dimethylallyltransferase MiaA [Trichocoleus desertorum ATA4-8-CV12]